MATKKKGKCVRKKSPCRRRKSPCRRRKAPCRRKCPTPCTPCPLSPSLKNPVPISAAPAPKPPPAVASLPAPPPNTPKIPQKTKKKPNTAPAALSSIKAEEEIELNKQKLNVEIFNNGVWDFLGKDNSFGKNKNKILLKLLSDIDYLNSLESKKRICKFGNVNENTTIKVLTWNCLGNSLKKMNDQNPGNPFEFLNSDFESNGFLKDLNKNMKSVYEDFYTKKDSRIFSLPERECSNFKPIELISGFLCSKIITPGFGECEGIIKDTFTKQYGKEYIKEAYNIYTDDNYGINSTNKDYVEIFIQHFKWSMKEAWKNVKEKNKAINDTKKYIKDYTNPNIKTHTFNILDKLIDQQYELIIKQNADVLFLQECHEKLKNKLTEKYFYYENENKPLDTCIFILKKHKSSNYISSDNISVSCNLDGINIRCYHLDSEDTKAREQFEKIEPPEKGILTIIGMDSNIKFKNSSVAANQSINKIFKVLSSDDKNVTCNKTRTFLQTQLSKGGITDNAYKDLILCNERNDFKCELINNINGSFDINSLLPNSNFPSDHAMVINEITLPPQEVIEEAIEEELVPSKFKKAGKRIIMINSLRNKLKKAKTDDEKIKIANNLGQELVLYIEESPNKIELRPFTREVQEEKSETPKKSEAERRATEQARVAAAAEKRATKQAERRADNESKIAAAAKKRATEQAERRADNESKIAAAAEKRATDEAGRRATEQARVAAAAEKKATDEAVRRATEQASSSNA
jgi:hypothetical protein